MKRTPGPNRYYKFKHKEIKDYKRIVREMINSYLNVYQLNILNECKFCFASATALFKEMNDMDTSKPLILNNEVFDEKNRDTENDPFKGTSIEGRD